MSVFFGGITGSSPVSFGSSGETQGIPKILKAPPLFLVEYTLLIVITILLAGNASLRTKFLVSSEFGKSNVT